MTMLSPQVLYLYRYTTPTPIGEFIILVNISGIIYLSNWIEYELTAVQELRRAYKPCEIIIENCKDDIIDDIEEENNNNNSNNNNSNNNNNNNIRTFPIRQIRRYFNFPISSDIYSNDKENNETYNNNNNNNNMSETKTIINKSISLQERQKALHAILQSVPIQFPKSKSTFTQNVWETLYHNIPVGKVISYGNLAKMCNAPNASRSVGQVMRRNHICIFLPCHRVIGANNNNNNKNKNKNILTGFSSGIWRKLWLLEYETAGLQWELVRKQVEKMNNNNNYNNISNINNNSNNNINNNSNNNNIITSNNSDNTESDGISRKRLRE